MRRLFIAILALILPVQAMAQATKQISQWPAASSMTASDKILLQQGGTGTPYTYGTVAQILSGSLPAQFSTLAASSNATVGGTLGVTGAATLSSTLGVTGTITGSGSIIAGNGGSAKITLSSGAITATSGQNITLTTGGAANSFIVGNSGGGLGNALTITTNTNGNTAGGASPNTVLVGNVLTSPFYRTPGNTYTLSGSTTQTPLSLTVNYAGSSTAALRAFQMTIPSDTLDASGATNAPALLYLAQNVGGVGTKGGRIVFLPLLNINAAISGDTTSQQYQPMYPQAQASVNVGGTNTGSGSRGYLYGYGQAILQNGATNWGLLNGGGEFDVAAEAGSSVRDIYGKSIIFLSTHAVAGARENQALMIGAQPGASATWTRGIGFGNTDGAWAMATAGTLVGVSVQQNNGAQSRNAFLAPPRATYGVDWEPVDFAQQSGRSFRGPGFSVDGTGQITAGSVFIGSGSGGGIIDVPAVNVVTAVAISVAGTGAAGLNNYVPNDIVVGTSSPVKGQFKVTHTKVIAAQVVAGGTGGTPGAVTITGTTGTGTKFQATGTINGSGALTGALTVTVPGDYTVNPTNTAIEPVTGGGLTGATVSLGIGVLTATILVPEISTGTAATITPTGGSGAGLVLTPTWSTRAGLDLQTSGGDASFGGGLWVKGISTTGNGLTYAEHQLYGATSQRKLITFYEENSGVVLRSQIGLNASNDFIIEQFNASGSSLGMALSFPNATGLPKFGRSGAWTANGSVATTMTSLGPSGAHTTVQKWLTVKDDSGTTYYIPAY